MSDVSDLDGNPKDLFSCNGSNQSSSEMLSERNQLEECQSHAESGNKSCP